ncbi:MAG: hypothetical protein GXY89_02510 [Tissierellia bacterium]|nr:hypothetical protein [Tissierellia bacterium]
MKKRLAIFLAISYILNIIGFGGIILLNIPFHEIFSNPSSIALFVLGTLGPGILGIILSKSGEKLYKNEFNIIHIVITLILILTHFGLYKFMGELGKNIKYQYILSISISIILFGIQEIGWYENVFKVYEEEKGLIKSSIIVGLFKTLGFLPLILLPGFIIRSDSLAYFAMFLVGTSALSIFLKKFTDSFIYSLLFIGIIYGIMVNMNFSQGISMVLIGFIECIVLYGLQDFIKNKNELK